MLDVFDGWMRVMASGFSLQRTGLDSVETLVAAQEVITARTPMICLAVTFPLCRDHEEITRMVAEKIEAFGQAAVAAYSTFGMCQATELAHLERLHGLSASPDSLAAATPLARAGGIFSLIAVHSLEAVARFGSSVIAPVHRTATANARRLSLVGDIRQIK